MNCRRAQSDIALWAGDDLDEAGLLSLRRHLDDCPECRCYMEEMQLLMRLVEECPLREEGDEASKRAVEDSLWPTLSTRLVSLSSPRSDRFNGWIPAVTVAAVCLAMVLIASPPAMLAPQAAPLVSSADEESWPLPEASPPIANPSLASPLPKWDPPTVRPQKAFAPKNSERPRFAPKHPIELLLESGSLPPGFPELNGRYEFFLDQSDPSRPVLYYRRIP
jgi:hypothetical protein